MLVDGCGVRWANKLVDGPNEHDGKICDAQNQQRYPDAVAIIERIHS